MTVKLQERRRKAIRNGTLDSDRFHSTAASNPLVDRSFWSQLLPETGGKESQPLHAAELITAGQEGLRYVCATAALPRTRTPLLGLGSAAAHQLAEQLPSYHAGLHPPKRPAVDCITREAVTEFIHRSVRWLVSADNAGGAKLT
jgi:hypothetical protein